MKCQAGFQGVSPSVEAAAAVDSTVKATGIRSLISESYLQNGGGRLFFSQQYFKDNIENENGQGIIFMITRQPGSAVAAICRRGFRQFRLLRDGIGWLYSRGRNHTGARWLRFILFGILILLPIAIIFPPACPRWQVYQEGKASWYGPNFYNRKTASGELFQDGDSRFTAAHPTLPFGSEVLVENLLNGKMAIVRINDRGPYAAGRIIDLNRAAAEHLELVECGVAPVVLYLRSLPTPPEEFTLPPELIPAEETPLDPELIPAEEKLENGGNAVDAGSAKAAAQIQSEAAVVPVSKASPESGKTVTAPAPVPVPVLPPKASSPPVPLTSPSAPEPVPPPPAAAVVTKAAALPPPVPLTPLPMMSKIYLIPLHRSGGATFGLPAIRKFSADSVSPLLRLPELKKFEPEVPVVRVFPTLPISDTVVIPVIPEPVIIAPSTAAGAENAP